MCELIIARLILGKLNGVTEIPEFRRFSKILLKINKTVRYEGYCYFERLIGMGYRKVICFKHY